MGDYRQQLFNRGTPSWAVLLGYGALSLILVLVDGRFHQIDGLRQSLALLENPLAQVAHLPEAAMESVGRAFQTTDELRSQNEQLRRQLATESALALEAATLSRDLAALRDTLKLRDQHRDAKLVTEILAMGHNPFVQNVLIGAGRSSDLVPGSPVVSLNGLMGQVTRVNLNNSEVTLLTDKNQSVPVEVVRNGVRTMAYGGGDGSLVLSYLPAEADVVQGDLLVTSGIDLLYPAGLPVAVVKELQNDPTSASFKRAICTPLVNNSDYRYVLVLNPAHAEPELNADAAHLDAPRHQNVRGKK
jgi:rod shape-determining protein MreC